MPVISTVVSISKPYWSDRVRSKGPAKPAGQSKVDQSIEKSPASAGKEETASAAQTARETPRSAFRLERRFTIHLSVRTGEPAQRGTQREYEQKSTGHLSRIVGLKAKVRPVKADAAADSAIYLRIGETALARSPNAPPAFPPRGGTGKTGGAHRCKSIREPLPGVGERAAAPEKARVVKHIFRRNGRNEPVASLGRGHWSGQ